MTNLAANNVAGQIGYKARYAQAYPRSSGYDGSSYGHSGSSYGHSGGSAGHSGGGYGHSGGGYGHSSGGYGHSGGGYGHSSVGYGHSGGGYGHGGGGGFSIDDGFENDKVKAMKELLRRDNIPGQLETGGYQSVSPMKKSSMIRNVSPTSGFKTPS